MKKEKSDIFDVIVIGGGAAGFFSAIQCAEKDPSLRILIVEKSSKLLSKVKISGGGRCNVTHACFDSRQMIENYPRGAKELQGIFYRFLGNDMISWLESKGVKTKIEEDGRVFPITDNSETIINCFLDCCSKYKIKINTQEAFHDMNLTEEGNWAIKCKQFEYKAKNLVLATGSSPSVWKLLKKKEYTIVSPVPSLFTFNIKHPIISGLAGISLPNANVHILNTIFQASGPLLITHWGLSGPAILKLSAWAARALYDQKYHFTIRINWVNQSFETIREKIISQKSKSGRHMLRSIPIFGIPKRFWSQFIGHLGLAEILFANLNKRQISLLADSLFKFELTVNGKSTYKAEFVTCGGIDTKQVNFKTMESKLHPRLFFSGEILNIDGITGGFNFQAAWSTAYVVSDTITTSK